MERQLSQALGGVTAKSLRLLNACHVEKKEHQDGRSKAE